MRVEDAGEVRGREREVKIMMGGKVRVCVRRRGDGREVGKSRGSGKGEAKK